MYLVSFSMVVSACIIGGAIFASTWFEQKHVDKQNIFQITPSGNLVKYNKKTLQMTLCGLSDQRYRCVDFDK